MTTYLETSVTLYLLVVQQTPFESATIVDMNEDRDMLDEYLEPSQRIVEVQVNFPVNFFKPAEYKTVLQAQGGEFFQPTGGTAQVDRHVAFPDD